jgi:hypothetical protein
MIVNADSAVGPGLTRAWTRMGDTIFHRRTLETLRAWRFEPGIRQGVPVRSGFYLHIDSGIRDDTIPSRLERGYRLVVVRTGEWKWA